MVQENQLKTFNHTFTFSPIGLSVVEGKTPEVVAEEAITELKKLGAHVKADKAFNRKKELVGIRRQPETYSFVYPIMSALGITGTVETVVFESMLQEAIASILAKEVKEGKIPDYTWDTILNKLKEYYEDSDTGVDGLGRKLLSKLIDSFVEWREKNKKDASGTKLIVTAIRKKFDYESTFRLRQNLDLIQQVLLEFITNGASEQEQGEFAEAMEKLIELSEKAKTLEPPVEPTASMF